MFVIYFRLFTICDVDTNPAMNICSIYLLIVLFLHVSESFLKKELVMIYLLSDIRLLLYFLFVNFLILPEDRFFLTLLVKVHSLLPIPLLAATLFTNVSIFFAVCTVLVLIYLFTISTLVKILTTAVARSLDLTYV